MKFSVNIGELADGLKTAGRAISGTATLPVLENAMIEAVEDGGTGYLAVSGTDLEIGLRTRVPARVEEPGATTLPARLLSNLMSTWRGEAEAFAELDAETQKLSVKSDGASAEVKGIAAEEYPVLADPSDWQNVGVDAYTFREALDRAAFSAATDESRPILTGVYMHADGGKLVLSAADGFRLSVVETEADVEGVGALERGIIVPAQGLKELAKLLPGAGKPVRIAFKPARDETVSQVAFVVYDKDGDAETVLVSQLIGGNFPDYKQIIPKGTSLSVTADVWALQNAVRGAMVFAAQAANIVQLYVSDGEVVIEGTSAEMGKQEAEVAVETDGYMPDYHDQDGLGAIAVNGAYMLDALAAVGSNEEVRIDMTTPSSPLKMQPVGDGAFLHIIMPMHLGQ